MRLKEEQDDHQFGAEPWPDGESLGDEVGGYLHITLERLQAS